MLARDKCIVNCSMKIFSNEIINLGMKTEELGDVYDFKSPIICTYVILVNGKYIDICSS